jgi:hypothetical protein
MYICPIQEINCVIAKKLKNTKKGALELLLAEELFIDIITNKN